MKGYAQRGFSLVSAIFLLVVLAGLGAAMVTFSTAQHQGLALDMLGSRGYQAANAGIEWAAYNIAANPGVPVLSQTLTGLDGNLADFTVTVSYTVTSVTDTDVSFSYAITSTAVHGTPGTADYIGRVINAKM